MTDQLSLLPMLDDAEHPSDADKVNAELKKEYTIECTTEVINAQEREIRHQKYKRCLANADACMHKRWRNDEGFDYARSTRHMNTWLSIAEKIKPNN